MPLGSIFTFFALITSFVITYKAIPSIILISRLKGLTDKPDGKRKLHKEIIPTLGGVALFGGLLVSYAIWVGKNPPHYLAALIASLVVLFFIGIKDDILVINNYTKLAGQFIAASIIVFMGGISIPGLDGLFGITSFPSFSGELFSVFAIIVIINAYNLIDGIDGLAGMVSIIGSTVFGIWFYAGGHYHEAILSFALVGALVGFTLHNYEPAKIFMGDTGSQLIGFTMAITGFKLMQINGYTPGFSLNSPAIFVFSVMIIPIYDTMRIIIIRVFKGASPMTADANHIHHFLLRLGMRHSKIAIYLSFFNVLIILASLYINSWNVHIYFAAVLFMAASILPFLSSLTMLEKKYTSAQNPDYQINGFRGEKLSVRRNSRDMSTAIRPSHWIRPRFKEYRNSFYSFISGKNGIYF